MNKITLGTAQLGLNYGINAAGQPTEGETFKILKYASDNGLNSIDTSPNYGDSEKRIGKFIEKTDARETFVITRLEAQDFPEEIWRDKEVLSQKIEKEFELSCTNLNLKRIPAYILHFADQAFKNDGVVLDELVKMKERSCIEFIGTSLYTGEELEKCIDDKRIDIVQIPFSILDRRLLESGLLNKTRERDLMVFARSVYLQGLLFMDSDRLPINLENVKKILDNVHCLANSYDMDISELCLKYALSVDGISSIAVGVDNLEHVKDNIRIASSTILKKTILKEIEKLPQMPPELIDIRSWSPSYNFTRN